MFDTERVHPPQKKHRSLGFWKSACEKLKNLPGCGMSIGAAGSGDVARMVFGPLGDEAEAGACARLMAESEPWLTLGRGYESALELIADRLKEVYVARLGGKLAGHVVVNMQGPFAGYIQALVVAPEWRGRGIGARLLGFAEERIFRDSPNVFLCVSGFNRRAQQFYARLGYERIGELKDYVIAGESEILMRKSIGPKTGFRP
jgi:ribosomal protein S18 acetylase RimI-like enzyme